MSDQKHPYETTCKWCNEGYLPIVSSISTDGSQYVHADTPIGRVLCPGPFMMVVATLTIDSKYCVRAVRDARSKTVSLEIVNRITGRPIPDDEPKMLFRAKDNTAALAIIAYRNECIKDRCPESHIDGTNLMIGQFLAWRTAHPELMKRPD